MSQSPKPVRHWYVVCDAYTMGPFTLEEAERAQVRMEKQDTCYELHAITNTPPSEPGVRSWPGDEEETS